MKISAEVREFAKLNPPAAHPEEGLSQSKARLEGGEGVATAALTLEDAEAGMREMSEKYREGGDLYVSTKQ